MIEERNCGIQLPNADAAEAAQLFNRRLTDEKWLTNARKEAVRLGEEQFNRDKLAARLESVLRRAVGDGSHERQIENAKKAA